MVFFVAASLGLNAQLSLVAGQSLEGYGDTDDTSIKIDVQVSAGDDAVGEWYWEINRPGSMPTDWIFSVCDINTCYAPGVETCPETKPNLLNPGESLTFNIYLNPKEVEGMDDLELRLFNVNNSEDTYLTASLYYEVAVVSNVLDQDVQAEFKLFPNPTSDYFQIENDDNIHMVSLHSVVGKEIAQYKHEIGQAYSVSDLSSGFYMARLIDESGRTLKIIRFNKK